MRFHSEPIVSFEEALAAAEKLMIEKNPKLRLLSKLMISRKIRPYAYFCYHYFRWVDDYIDNKSISIDDKKSFHKKQTSLVYSYIGGEDMQVNFAEEYFLRYFFEFVLEQNAQFLMDEVKLLLKTIGDDIKRLENNGIFSENEMQSYMNDNIKSFFIITNFFLNPKFALRYQNNYNYSRTLVNVFLIDDIAEDFSLGYINLSAEDLQQYQINPANLINNKNLEMWLKDRFYVLKKLLNEEALIVKKFPLKLKIFWFGLFPYCVHKMNRIKIYDYNPKKDIPKSSIKEIKLYLLTILSALEYMYRIFLPFKVSNFLSPDGKGQ